MNWLTEGLALIHSLKEGLKDPPVLQNYHAGMGLYFMEMTKHRYNGKI